MGCVMFGRERDQAGVLIELKEPYVIDPGNEKDVISIRNTLWFVNVVFLLTYLWNQHLVNRPIVEEANKVAPAFSRIFKEMILLSSREKPLPRAGKGTITRKAALAGYQTEIDKMWAFPTINNFFFFVISHIVSFFFSYAKVDATAKVDSIVPPPSWNTEHTIAWLQKEIVEIRGGQQFSVTGDLFQQGMDRCVIFVCFHFHAP